MCAFSFFPPYPRPVPGAECGEHGLSCQFSFWPVTYVCVHMCKCVLCVRVHVCVGSPHSPHHGLELSWLYSQLYHLSPLPLGK